jgi:hypothetical protein
MIAPPQPRVAHPFQSHRKAGPPPALLVGCKGWVIERTGVPDERFCSLGWRSETVVPLHNAETSKVEVD